MSAFSVLPLLSLLQKTHASNLSQTVLLYKSNKENNLRQPARGFSKGKIVNGNDQRAQNESDGSAYRRTSAEHTGEN
jgi:hypothetical protein